MKPDKVDSVPADKTASIAAALRGGRGKGARGFFVIHDKECDIGDPDRDGSGHSATTAGNAREMSNGECR
jgi:hypothetical protein